MGYCGREVYLAGGLRSHIGLKNGMFRHIPAEDLAAALLREVIEKYPAAADADEIICGNAVGTGGNITRLMALKAGVSASVPCITLDMQCASAAAAIQLAAAKIGCGMADLVVAGGFESSSMQPLRVYNEADPRYRPEGFTVAQFSPETESPLVMLEGAERTAQLAGFTREELDAIAVESHRKALRAAEEGVLEDVVAPLFGSLRDEGIRKRMSPRLAARMPSLFSADAVEKLTGRPGEPVLTACNACLINDGAAFVVLASERFLADHPELRGELRFVAACDGGVETGQSPRGAVTVGDLLLEREGVTPEAVDAFEYNEAFAVITGIFGREHPELMDRYCRYGGALAYGHPYGASGAILLLHLWQSLKREGGRLGLVSIAGAGGLGSASLWEYTGD